MGKLKKIVETSYRSFSVSYQSYILLCLHGVYINLYRLFLIKKNTGKNAYINTGLSFPSKMGDNRGKIKCQYSNCLQLISSIIYSRPLPTVYM